MHRCSFQFMPMDLTAKAVKRKRRMASQVHDVEGVRTVASALDSSRVKALLYKQEPNMARIKDASLRLVSTTSGLLLKSIADAAKESASSKRRNTAITKKKVIRSSKRKRGGSPSASRAAHDDNGIDSPLISLEAIRQTVSANPSLQFLVACLHDVEEEKGNQLRPFSSKRVAHGQSKRFKPNPKDSDATGAASSANLPGQASSKKSRKPPSIPAEFQSAVRAAATNESDLPKAMKQSTQIQLDEEDYD